MTVKAVIARRRAQRAELLEGARRFAETLDPSLDVEAVVVFGSVARGDFNLWSDIDVLVVAGAVPDRFLDRVDALGRPAARVEPIVWTPSEWRKQLRRRNPIAIEATTHGVWLVGSPA
ncbi:MAG: nucleotidyltransferase domain-containing protein [Actinomycetota bacterium]|nr:nucleotidyltransferase domain-containing protein [Actinomycetota bacterium]